MTKRNHDVREAAVKANVYLWQIGDRLGMCDSNFARLMRKELPVEKKKQIFAIIEDLGREKQSNPRAASQ